MQNAAVLHIQNIAEKENINVEKMLFTIFIAFSRATSIIVALASHTREPKAMSN